MPDSFVTDHDIQALVDNELTHEDEKRVRALIVQKDELYKRYETLLKQKKLLKMWWTDGQH